MTGSWDPNFPSKFDKKSLLGELYGNAGATRVFFMKLGAQRVLQIPKIMLNPCKVVRKHTFHLYAKSCSGDGPQAPFGWFLDSKIPKKLKKYHRKRNQKNECISRTHEDPPPLPRGTGGRGGHANLFFGPGQDVPGLRIRSSLYKPRPGILKKPFPSQGIC